MAFEKYWYKNRKQTVFNRYFNTRRSVKHACKLAYIAGMGYGANKSDKINYLISKFQTDSYYKMKKKLKSHDLESDCFQTALTETFTENEIEKFFDNHDEIMARIQNETNTS